MNSIKYNNCPLYPKIWLDITHNLRVEANKYQIDCTSCEWHLVFLEKISGNWRVTTGYFGGSKIFNTQDEAVSEIKKIQSTVRKCRIFN